MCECLAMCMDFNICRFFFLERAFLFFLYFFFFFFAKLCVSAADPLEMKTSASAEWSSSHKGMVAHARTHAQTITATFCFYHCAEVTLCVCSLPLPTCVCVCAPLLLVSQQETEPRVFYKSAHAP